MNDPFLSEIFLVQKILVPLIKHCYDASGGRVAVGEGQYSLLKLAFLSKREETVDVHKDRLKHFIRLCVVFILICFKLIILLMFYIYRFYF